jgi:hypothetical protein
MKKIWTHDEINTFRKIIFLGVLVNKVRYFTIVVLSKNLLTICQKCTEAARGLLATSSMLLSMMLEATYSSEISVDFRSYTALNSRR